MNKIKAYLLLFLFLIIQTTIIHKFSFFGVIPNLVFVFAILYASVNSVFDACVFSFVCGLVLDFSTGKILGFNAIAVTYIGYAVSLVSKKFFYKNVASSLLMTFLSTIIYQSVYCILNYIIWQIGDYSSAFPIILIEAVYNSVISIFVYGLFIKKYAKM